MGVVILRKTCVLLLVISISLSGELTQVSDVLFNKFYVHIINSFQNVTIGAHYRSKDNDLGMQHILVGGEFQWHFLINFFWTTLFHCDLWWDGGHISYVAYWHDYGFEDSVCGDGHCRWKAGVEGISSFNVKQNVYQLQYKWEH